MGLPFARGEAVLVLSADGQDNPQAIPEVLKRWKQGAQVVWALRKSRKNEPFFKKIAAIIFYKVLAFLIKSQSHQIDPSRADFYLLDKKAVAAITACRERNTSLFGLISWLGFKQDFVEYHRREREIGESKWNFRKRIDLAKDWIVAFSGLPLKAISIAGVIIAFLGFLYAIYIIRRATQGSPVPGWSSLMVVILLLGGLQMIMFGVVGEYLWKNLDESRKRPLAFIEKSTLEEPEQPEVESQRASRP
jgi:dolichol-phosphate mannosyltransferase